MSIRGILLERRDPAGRRRLRPRPPGRPGEPAAASALVPEGETQARVLARLLEPTAQPFVGVDLDGRIAWSTGRSRSWPGTRPASCSSRPIAEITPRALARAAGRGARRRSGRRAGRCGTRRNTAARTARSSRSRSPPTSTATTAARSPGSTRSSPTSTERKQVEDAPPRVGGAVPPALRRGPGRLPRDRHRGADRQHQPDRVRDARLRPRGDDRPAGLRLRRRGVPRAARAGVRREDRAASSPLGRSSGRS